jgi:PAP2 superfamily
MQLKVRVTALALLIGCGVVAVPAGQGQPDRFSSFWGPNYRPLPPPPPSIEQFDALQATVPPGDRGRMHHWNSIAIDTSGRDHEPVAGGEQRVFGEQLGPGRASRAMAIVHIAIFDAVNSIAHTHHGFTGIPDVLTTASMDAAIAMAAHDTLVALYPSQRVHCDELLLADLAAIPDSHEKKLGVETGQRAASAILELTAQDGSQYLEPVVGVGYFPSQKPGRWRPDPVSGIQMALGAYWGKVKPLAIASAKAHRVPPPPSLQSEAYARAFNEVKTLGGDGITTPTLRTNDQTIAGIYWAYDGTPSLCAPPRLYNQITVALADQMGVGTVELARLLALVNVAMSDAGIASWESKYFWDFWRPITGIREADPGTGPTGRGDNNPQTQGDPAFTPLGAPASNLDGPDFTPPFPAYPSGHATFGGAVFQMLRHYFGTDAIAFTFVSDELNGITRDRNGVLRPLVPRSFATLAQAEEENGQSRIYLGIHWEFDKTAGIAQGRAIADEVFRKAARPR